MKAATLRRYVAGKFLFATITTFLVLALLIFMIDFVELLRQGGKAGGVPAYRLAAIALLRLPAYTEFLIPFTVLCGSIAALLMLSRKSELTVMRAGGMSVWQFLAPGIVVAAALGGFASFGFNPLAAHARGVAEKTFAETFGRQANLLTTDSGRAWLRQDGPDGQTVITAVAAADRGRTLAGVTVIGFDSKNRFAERIDAARAELKSGYWAIHDAWVAKVGQESEHFETYLISTYLTPERAEDALGSVISVSFWELPGLIDVAEKAKLSSSRLRIQYELLIARPLLCAAMVLLAATVSLRSFRSGKIQTMVVTGMVGGFGFFLLAEVSRQIGVSGLAPPWAAVWFPVTLLIMVSLTVLLHQEDG
jgi:lipopolysaccharide export system permease protein